MIVTDSTAIASTAIPDAKRPVRRVLHVFHSLGMGGAETWLLSLLEWFANPPYPLTQ